MAEEIDIDEGSFFWQDFSTATDWELFTAQLGELFQKYAEDGEAEDQVDDDTSDGYICQLEVQSETLELENKKVVIEYYYSSIASKASNKEDKTKTETETETESNVNASDDVNNILMYHGLMSPEGAFGPPAAFGASGQGRHAISCAFGLQRFVLIKPHPTERQFFFKPSEFCYFLSAAAVVTGEYRHSLPIFVQIHDPKWNMYLGVGMHSIFRTNFDIVALHRGPMECRYLSGLLTMFKEKLPPNSNTKTMAISARNTYFMPKVKVRLPMKVPFLKLLSEHDADVNGDSNFLETKKFIALPYGYFPDAATEIQIVCSWLKIGETTMDSQAFTELVPAKSPNTDMYQLVHAISYLSSCLRDYAKLCNENETLENFVGSSFSESFGDVNIPKAFQLLTDTHFHPQRSSNSSQAAYQKIAGPLNGNELKEFLAYLFPDLYTAFAHYAYASDEVQQTEVDIHRIKSSQLDSLASRLSCLLATTNSHFGGKSGLAQVWAAFIKELRFIWDVRLSIPGVAAGFPDTRSCLLNQKLQMLNYCIERSKFRKYGNQSYQYNVERDAEVYDKKAKNETAYQDADDNDVKEEDGGEDGGEDDGDVGDRDENSVEDDDDEFYDCSEYSPEGRDKRLGDLKLLDSDEWLYIPITQDAVPKTEDELQADAEAMLKFGPGSDMNMQLMCSSLQSDMEAFKAANPKAKLEDFIRWYSPKDWEEDEITGVGKLSARMEAPGNTWQTVWKDAQPVPASKQKRLFDETTAALKVLSYLESRNISEIYGLTLISVLNAALLKVKHILAANDILDIFETHIETLFADLSYLSRDVEIYAQQDNNTFELRTPNPAQIIEKLELLEAQIYQYKCFEKLTGCPESNSLTVIKQKFSEMIKNGNCCNIKQAKRAQKNVAGDNASVGINNLNIDLNEVKQNLLTKEYVLRLCDRGEMTVGPQFLRAIIKGEEVRLCGAFTKNTVFF